MRALLLVTLLGGIASADTFGGFAGTDRSYLVSPDRVCTPLPLTATSGAPTCEKAAADVIAKLDFKPLVQQSGPKADFAATASGRTLTVTKGDGTVIATWSASDPISKVAGVYSSQYADRVAIAYVARRLGKDVTDVVAFDVGRTKTQTPDPIQTPTPPAQVVVENPQIKKAVDTARKASKAKQLAAWHAVLAIDPQHSESLYQIAVLQAGAKKTSEALASLGALSQSTRADAIEWLVEARYAKSFEALRGDTTFRKDVGFDRKPVNAYERLMGFGGTWEQTGTSCDTPEVRFVATRDRVVRVNVKSACSGNAYDLPFKGTWSLEGDQVVLTFATRGKAVAADDQSVCQFEPHADEDALHCALGKDIEFSVLPTRR
ncbi:MAG TPA: hypothetical protein VGM39_05725 [Kofleriaceae bacterium]|jgi:hypothetical protein